MQPTALAANDNICHCSHEKIPLSKPKYSNIQIRNWAAEAAVSTYSYDYVNQRKALEQNSHYFTPHGWSNFVQALRQSNSLDTVVKRKMIVSAVPIDTPVILQQNQLNGIYNWRIQVPLLVTYQNSDAKTQVPLDVQLLIKRRIAYDGSDSVGIEQFVAMPTTEHQSQAQTATKPAISTNTQS